MEHGLSAVRNLAACQCAALDCRGAAMEHGLSAVRNVRTTRRPSGPLNPPQWSTAFQP